MAKLRVALLFGGQSSEHSISCATAAGVLGAIDRTRYDVIPIGITESGLWTLAEDDADKWALRKGDLVTVDDNGRHASFVMDGSCELILTEAGNTASLGIIDLVFPVLHGPFGEDGTLQGFLELVGVPYVGNGVLASAAGMDKEFSKALFLAAGIPATPHFVLREAQWKKHAADLREQIKELGELPYFVKPARAGSSVGVSKVKSFADLDAAIKLAFEHDDKLVIERGIIGREVECAVLESPAGAAPRVSVAGEIVVTGREFYDFEAKYQDEASVQLIVPAKLTDNELQEMQLIAAQAFDALGCEGLARVDFFLTADGFLVNEINTMPGFTPLSMFPALWQASGISYPKLIDELINLALN